MTRPARHIPFTKMHGAGNDFVVLDTAPPGAGEDAAVVRFLCDRRLGVGADGALWMERLPSSHAVFRMHFYNSDGGRVNLCLNGSRCVAKRAVELGWAQGRFRFLVEKGELQAEVDGETVQLWIQPPPPPADPIALPPGSPAEHAYAVDTGDPHLVLEVSLPYLERVDLDAVARPIRHWTGVSPAGANVHLVAFARDAWWIRSFERGVEGETLACGSGCISAAVAIAGPRSDPDAEILFHTRSGDVLGITPGEERWRLRGPAVTSFTGVARWEPSA